MCPDRERPVFADAAPPGAAAGSAPGHAAGAALSDTRAAIAASALLVAIYAVIFIVSGITMSQAIRGALANGLPDGLVALAALRTARRLDARRSGVPKLLRAYIGRGLLAVALALVAKPFLFWVDWLVAGGQEPFRLVAGIVVWQAFTSALIFATVAAGSQALLADRRLRAEEARTARAEALRARAELSALRAQLNPHFLFNVLHSVLGMVRGDPVLAERALEQLGDLLRYALRVHRDGVDRTALRHEWEFMESYLSLQGIRLGDRLVVSRRVEEAALDRVVPTFCLQPLVENAVLHGIAPRASGGRLSISARMEGEALRLEVHNDASGGAPGPAGNGAGMGLRVLRERLEVLYGGRAGMTAGPEREGGYRVVLTLPAMPEAPEAGT